MPEHRYTNFAKKCYDKGMKDITHVDEKTANHVKTLMRQPNKEEDAARAAEAKEIVKFYKDNFDFVQLVVCENCGKDLCLWVLDRDQVQSNMTNHHLGLRRIVIGENLMSSRKRLDGAMGYECVCGADTRLSPVEQGILEETPWHGGTVPAIDPHIEAKIKQKIIATNFKPDVKDLDNGDTSIEGFTHKTLKGV